MEPTGIEAADDNTRNIQDITDEPCVLDSVQELLALLMDACEETGRYAFLHCDGVNWKLIGSFNPFTPPSKPEDDARDSKTLPTPINSPGGMKDLEVTMALNEHRLPEEHESDQNTDRKWRCQ